jgi:hypothetical protein
MLACSKSTAAAAAAAAAAATAANSLGHAEVNAHCSQSIKAQRSPLFEPVFKKGQYSPY